MTKHRILLLLIVGLLLTPALTLAQSTSMTEIDVNKVPELIQTISSWIRVIAYTASVGTIIYAGILYFNSANNPSSSAAAKNAIKVVLIGLAIVVLAEVIVRTTLGFVTQPVNQIGINNVLHP
jgi:hypothetical protein